MLWPCHTCPFGLPDEAEYSDNIILLAIGHSFREAARGITEAPLPPQFIALLQRLKERENLLHADGRVARRRRVRSDRFAGDPASLRARVATPKLALTAEPA